MTRVQDHEMPPGTWGGGVGAAAACLGIALLAGTSLSNLMVSGPAFPTVGPSRPAPEGNSGERVAVLRRLTEGPAAERAQYEVPGERDTTAPWEPLNINRVDAQALQALPGLGPGLAQRIVAYRETHGPFQKPEDLLQVPGIGARRYARLHGLIRTAETP